MAKVVTVPGGVTAHEPKGVVMTPAQAQSEAEKRNAAAVALGIKTRYEVKE